MRTWDLVLVDDALAPSIVDFRKWEEKKRQSRQERITLMAESTDEVKSDGNETAEGVDTTLRKPVGLNAVAKLLESTYSILSQSAEN